MKYEIRDPFTFPGQELDHLIYEIWVEDVQFWAIFADTSEALSSEEVEFIRGETGMVLSHDAITFKFDRYENFQNNTLYDKPSKPLLSQPGMTALGEAIAKCFEMHHHRTGVTEYYAFAVDKKLARFYTLLSNRHSAPLGFEAHTQIGSDKMAFVFRKNEG